MLARDAQFDSHFGSRTGVRKTDSKLLWLGVKYPVLLQTRHPRPVPGNQGRKSFLWSGCWEVIVRDDFGVFIKEFSEKQRKRRSDSDLEREAGLKRYFPTPENAPSSKRPETL